MKGHQYATRKCYVRPIPGRTPGITAIANPRTPEASRVRLPKKGKDVEPPRVSFWIGKPQANFSDLCAKEARPLVAGVSLKIWTTE